MAGELHFHYSVEHDSFGNTFPKMARRKTNLTCNRKEYHEQLSVTHFAYTKHSFYIEIATILFTPNLKSFVTTLM